MDHTEECREFMRTHNKHRYDPCSCSCHKKSSEPL